MKKLITLLGMAGLATLPAIAHADTLVDKVNGVQVTSDGSLQRFNALHIDDDGRVIAVLGETDARPSAEVVIDGAGRTMLPGLIDAHGHILGLGFAALQLDLMGVSSLEEMKQRLADYAASNPGTGWIVGRGWNQELWADKRMPTAADLDEVLPDRPVWLERVDGHASIANSAAMRAAGVTASTMAPEGGEIIAGLFVDTAMALIGSKIPGPTPDDHIKAFAKAQEIMLANGLTGAHDMGMGQGDWMTFKHAGDHGTLKVRITAYAAGTERWAEINGKRPSDWLYDDRLKLAGVKFVADGALGSRGAYLKAPYADRPDTRGLQIIGDADLLAQAKAVSEAGGQLAIHAIGDAANAQVIRLFETLAADQGIDKRWRNEHLQVADPADLPRLAPAGIIASMQPTHQTSDRTMAEARLGPDRLGGAYAWQTLAKLGVPLAFGSDFPVELPNPFHGLAAAVYRQGLDDQPPGGWRPHERLSFQQALRGFTIGAAYAGFAETKVGSLEPGKWADFIIVDTDPTATDRAGLAGTKVLETWVAGEKVYSAAD